MAQDSDGDYARILRRLIDDPGYGRLPAPARLVWLTLLIAPEFRVLGIATLDVPTLERRTGLKAKVAADALEILEDVDVIRRDGAWCWIRNHLRFQENSEAWRNSWKSMQGLSKRLANLPSGLTFVAEFVELYASYGFKFALPPRLQPKTDMKPICNGDIIDNPEPEPETPEPETPEPETPEPETPKRPHDTSALYAGCFNAVFDRRVTATPEVQERVNARLKKYPAWNIVALPILVEAQGLPSDLRARLDLLMLLRDGKHPKTRPDGHTWGGTDWLERALGKMDQTVLDARLTDIARQFGVYDQLAICHVRMAA